MGIKRCPSFSKRPGFPCGLRVLLLDCDESQRKESEQLLQECSYEVGCPASWQQQSAPTAHTQSPFVEAISMSHERVQGQWACMLLCLLYPPRFTTNNPHGAEGLSCSNAGDKACIQLRITWTHDMAIQQLMRVSWFFSLFLLQVTLCSSTEEALSRLSSACSYDILLADKPSIKRSSDTELLLKGAEGIPCVFMASNPSSEEVMAGERITQDCSGLGFRYSSMPNFWQPSDRSAGRAARIVLLPLVTSQIAAAISAGMCFILSCTSPGEVSRLQHAWGTPWGGS